MSTPTNEHQEALVVLRNHYDILVKKIAKEIIEHREDFESPGFGSQADDIIEKHACHLSRLGTVYSILRWKSSQKKPEGKVPLGKNEFRCFGCGGVILSNEAACSICGWSWK
jgi:hypothetical protein